jgi:hypothetical protein
MRDKGGKYCAIKSNNKIYCDSNDANGNAVFVVKRCHKD